MKNMFKSVFSPRRRSASVTLAHGKKKLFKKNTFKKSSIKKLKKNTSRKSVIKKNKKKKPKTFKKSVRRKK